MPPLASGDRAFVGGLATDYGVLNTVRDALGRGHRVLGIEDAMHRRGARFTTTRLRTQRVA